MRHDEAVSKPAWLMEPGQLLMEWAGLPPPRGPPQTNCTLLHAPPDDKSTVKQQDGSRLQRELISLACEEREVISTMCSHWFRSLGGSEVVAWWTRGAENVVGSFI